MINRLVGACYIALFVGLGEIAKLGLAQFDIHFPASILGMLLLFLALSHQWLAPQQIAQAAEPLLKYMALFFIPVGVGLMQFTDLIAQYGLHMLLAVSVSASVTLVVVGHVFQAWLCKQPTAPEIKHDD